MGLSKRRSVAVQSGTKKPSVTHLTQATRTVRPNQTARCHSCCNNGLSCQFLQTRVTSNSDSRSDCHLACFCRTNAPLADMLSDGEGRSEASHWLRSVTSQGGGAHNRVLCLFHKTKKLKWSALITQGCHRLWPPDSGYYCFADTRCFLLQGDVVCLAVSLKLKSGQDAAGCNTANVSTSCSSVRQVLTSFGGANGGTGCYREMATTGCTKIRFIYKWLPRAGCEAESTGAIHFVSSTSKQHHTPVTKIKEAKLFYGT